MPVWFTTNMCIIFGLFGLCFEDINSRFRIWPCLTLISLHFDESTASTLTSIVSLFYFIYWLHLSWLQVQSALRRLLVRHTAFYATDISAAAWRANTIQVLKTVVWLPVLHAARRDVWRHILSIKSCTARCTHNSSINSQSLLISADISGC